MKSTKRQNSYSATLAFLFSVLLLLTTIQIQGGTSGLTDKSVMFTVNASAFPELTVPGVQSSGENSELCISVISDEDEILNPSDPLKERNSSEKAKQRMIDPFTPYLTGRAPNIVQELGEETENGVTIRKLIFHSYDYNEDNHKKTAVIFAVVARPVKKGNYPGLLVLHGGGGCAEIEKAKKWAALGYVVVALDEPGVAEPEKIPLSQGPWSKNKYGEKHFVVKPDIKTCSLFSGIIASVQGLYLLRSQPDVIKDKIGIVGISWGGYLTTFVSALENSMITASFSVYGSGFFDYGSAFQDLLHKMEPEDRAIWLKYLDAGRRANKIKTPFFIAAAANDHFFHVPAVTQTLTQIKGDVSHFFSPNNSHKVDLPGGTENKTTEEPGWVTMERIYFDYYLKGIGHSLPEIQKIKKEKMASGNIKIRFKVDSPLPVSNARVNYSQEGVKWTERKWELVSAIDLGNGWFEAEIPSNELENSFDCYATISDERPVSVSSYLIHCKK